ncbi:hypothetical protein [Terrihabitans sp. B22-R8]|uniref:hypothetical protein n=1 Tax=Terrihabitans sp. B22-R8 TaxID=3425128 RepID=UPI00403D0559
MSHWRPHPEGVSRGRRRRHRRGVQTFEHAEIYLRSVLGFFGITAPKVILAEGVAVSPEQREAATQASLSVIGGLQAA